MDIQAEKKPVAEKVVEEKKEPSESNVDIIIPGDTNAGIIIPQEDYRTSPLFYEIARYFGIEEVDYEESKEKLSMIADWAVMKAESNKIGNIMLAIRKLEDNVRPPAWGEKRYTNVYRYLKLLSRYDDLDKMLSAYEKEKSKK